MTSNAAFIESKSKTKLNLFPHNSIITSNIRLLRLFQIPPIPSNFYWGISQNATRRSANIDTFKWYNSISWKQTTLVGGRRGDLDGGRFNS